MSQTYDILLAPHTMLGTGPNGWETAPESHWFCITAATEQQGIIAAIFYSGNDIDLTLEKKVISPEFEGLPL